MNFEFLVPLVVEGLLIQADQKINGKDLNEDQLDAIVVGYAILATFGVRYAARTETHIDDQVVKGLLTFCADNAEEAGIEL